MKVGKIGVGEKKEEQDKEYVVPKEQIQGRKLQKNRRKSKSLKRKRKRKH